MAPLEGILFKTTLNAQGKPHTLSLNLNVKTVMKGKVLLYEKICIRSQKKIDYLKNPLLQS